ncbi:hypothetical protein VTK73DRAFT_7644 [Phialemonium thermophilum]|uniref:Thioesterase domain-containing protein n=1 Tax=Phialemonium thermophilum TaxID=223376 RepID=A0ABR3Y7F3_9PEZI
MPGLRLPLHRLPYRSSPLNSSPFLRPAGKTPTRLSSTAAESSFSGRASVPPPSTLRRAALAAGRAFLFTAIGFAMASATALPSVGDILSPPSDAETLRLFEPANADAREKEDFINSHPLVAALRANPDFTESRPHMKIPPAWRAHNLTGGTLLGPGRVTVAPFCFTEKDGKSFVQISHVGTDLCGHVGVVHGGFLATMLDEGLARCCFPVLPHNIGMTAKLEINYKAPAKADQYLVLRAKTTRVEGRKAWVEGHIETLPTTEGEKPTVLVTASALFISPKQASVMAKVYPVS